jgi:hypothetical protein
MKDELVGLTYLVIIFGTLVMITGSCLMRRIDSLAHAIDEVDKKYIN